MSESFKIELGNPLPLSFQLPASGTGLFPRALIYNSADVVVATIDLSEIGATARYTNPGGAFTPTTLETFTARFVVFSDAGHTTEALRYSRDQDSFVVTPNAEIDAQPILLDNGDVEVTAVLRRGNAVVTNATSARLTIRDNADNDVVPLTTITAAPNAHGGYVFTVTPNPAIAQGTYTALLSITDAHWSKSFQESDR